MLKQIDRRFVIESIGYPLERQFSDNYAFDGESHDFMESVYIDSGKVEISVDDKVYILGDGDIIFHAPMAFHRIRSAEGTSPKVYNLSAVIRGSVPENMYDGVYSLDSDERAELLGIFRLAHDFVNKSGEQGSIGHMAADRFGVFIMRICERNNKSSKLSSVAGAVTYRALVRTMYDGIYDYLSLAELAEKNYISVSYAKALFYRYAGMSAGSYYAKLQANEALRLIDMGMSVAEASERMNFSSPNYFSLFFKKHIGVTPSEYKKRGRTN